MKHSIKIATIFLFFLIVFPFCKTAFAGVSYILSRNGDYSTDDRAFLNTDTMYVQVEQNVIDYREINASVFILRSEQTKRKSVHSLTWDNELNAFIGSTSLENYTVGDRIDIIMALRGEDEIIKESDRCSVGYSGTWEIRGAVYEEGTGAPVEHARVRVKGVADIPTPVPSTSESYYPEEEDQFVLTDKDGTFTLEYEGIAGQEIVITAGKESLKNAGANIFLAKDDYVIIRPASLPEEDHSSYEYQSARNCDKCHSNFYNDWKDSDMADAAVNPLNQLVFLLYTAWYVTGDRSNFLDPTIFDDPNPPKVKGYGKIFEDATGRYQIIGDAGNIHDCADCHSPSFASHLQEDGNPQWDMRAGVLTDVDKLSSIDKQGVHCDLCHKIQKVHEEEEFWTEPGINYKVDLLRPDPLLKLLTDGKLMFGPLDDVTHKDMQASYVPQFKKSEICTPCHQDARTLFLQPVDEHDQPVGDPITRILWSEDTYREWRFSGYSGLEEDYPVNNYAGKVLQCQDCHMKDPPPDPNTGKSIADYTEVADPFYMQEETKDFGTKRDPRTIYPHHFEGTNQNLASGEKKRYLDWAVDLTITNAKVADGAVSFDVHVTNSHTGHTYPSGVTQRNVVLLVEASQSGETLSQINNQVVDTPGGNFPDGYYEGEGDYAGKPGKIFIKHNRMLVDNEDLAPFYYDILYAFAVEELYDTRIKANQTDTSHYEFQAIDNNEITINARLIYRFLPKGTMEFAAINGYAFPLEENDYESHNLTITLIP
ncbi:MAG: hypothetical protein MRJ65_08845 [Candidatus Brocadiaceae bacterium]|nr:hypothetical protein [Candidatus Brocadiaceae bacterium]